MSINHAALLTLVYDVVNSSEQLADGDYVYSVDVLKGEDPSRTCAEAAAMCTFAAMRCFEDPMHFTGVTVACVLDGVEQERLFAEIRDQQSEIPVEYNVHGKKRYVVYTSVAEAVDKTKEDKPMYLFVNSLALEAYEREGRTGDFVVGKEIFYIRPSS